MKKLTGIIKINSEVREARGEFAGQYVYTRLNRAGNECSVQESEAVNEMAEYVDYKQASRAIKQKVQLEEANRRIDMKVAKYEKDMYLEAQAINVSRSLRKAQEKYKPRTKAQFLMDKMGIDRVAVVDMLNKIEKHM